MQGMTAVLCYQNKHLTLDLLLQNCLQRQQFWGKFRKVTDAEGKPLSYVVNKTMMRIDLPKNQKKGNFQI